MATALWQLGKPRPSLSRGHSSSIGKRIELASRRTTACGREVRSGLGQVPWGHLQAPVRARCHPPWPAMAGDLSIESWS